jgi:hypothetical protein
MAIIKASKAKYGKLRQLQLKSPFSSRVLIVVLLLFVLSFFVNLKLIIFLIVATGFNAYLAAFQIKRGLPTDFELSTFSTVLVTVAFGWQWGIVMAILSKLFACVYTGSVLPDHFFMIATYIVGAIIASIFSSMNIFALGLVIVVINCVLMFLISKNYIGLDVTSNLSYTLTNLVFNFIVFSIFSELVKGLLLA